MSVWTAARHRRRSVNVDKRGGAAFFSRSSQILTMTKSIISTVLALLLGTLATLAHDRARTPVNIPDLPDYRTLKCDFHIHTVFSEIGRAHV